MKSLHERNRSEPASRPRYAVRTRQRHQGGGAAGADPIRRQPCARPVAAIDRRTIVRARAGRVAAHRASDRNRTGRSGGAVAVAHRAVAERSEEHTSELQSLLRISYAVFCLKTKKKTHNQA